MKRTRCFLFAIAVFMLPGIVEAQITLSTYYWCENPGGHNAYIKFFDKGVQGHLLRASVSYGSGGTLSNSFLLTGGQITNEADRTRIVAAGPSSVYRTISWIYTWLNSFEFSITRAGGTVVKLKKLETLTDPYGHKPGSSKVILDQVLACRGSDQPLYDLTHRFLDCGQDLWIRLTKMDRGMAYASLGNVMYEAEWYHISGYPIFDDHVGFSDARSDDRKFFFFKKADLDSGAQTLDVAIFDKGTDSMARPHQTRTCTMRKM